jgi:RNA polymerase sigma-70 factor (ECF subfamily)
MTMNGPRPDTGDEHRLLAAARAGDELAFGRLASRYRPGLELFCLLMLGCPDAAHDAVCETLLRGWRDVRRVVPAAAARIWIYRLATQVCLEDLDRADEPRGRGPLDGVRDTNDRSR